MSNILNQPVEKNGLLWLIDNFRFYEKIDGSKRQIMISGWIFDKENPAEDVEVTVSAGSAKVEIERMPRKDVCDMYDIAAENVGFRILIEAEAFDFNAGNILVTAKEELLSIDQELLDAHKVDNVHHMIDQFALNGNVIRMAGWGYLSDLYEEYRPLTVWAETDFPDGVLPSHVGEDQISPNGKYMIGKAQYMLRPDIISLFSTPEDQGRQWGFFLLLDMTEYASCDICFGEKGCNKKWHIDIEELRREKREKRRK